MEKIKLNDSCSYDLRSISVEDGSCSIELATNDCVKAMNDFKQVDKIDVYNEDGLIRQSLAGYSTYTAISYFPESETVRVVLKKTSLEDKVAELDKKVNGTVNETDMSLEQFKEYKIQQLGVVCRDTIYNGMDVETSKGKEHFTFNDDDQKDIKTLFDAALMTKMDVPYHQTKGACRIYSWQDAVRIYITLQGMLLYNTTYCNALNMIIREDLSTKEDVSKVVYGQEITGTRKENMDLSIAQGQALMDAILIACGLKEAADVELSEAAE